MTRTSPILKYYVHADLKFEPTDKTAYMAIWGKEPEFDASEFYRKTLIFNVFNGEFIGTLEIFLNHKSATGWRFVECRGSEENQVIRQEYLPLPEGYRITKKGLKSTIEVVSKLVLSAHAKNETSANWKKPNFITRCNNTETLAEIFPGWKIEESEGECEKSQTS